MRVKVPKTAVGSNMYGEACARPMTACPCMPLPCHTIDGNPDGKGGSRPGTAAGKLDSSGLTISGLQAAAAGWQDPPARPSMPVGSKVRMHTPACRANISPMPGGCSKCPLLAHGSVSREALLLAVEFPCMLPCSSRRHSSSRRSAGRSELARQPSRSRLHHRLHTTHCTMMCWARCDPGGVT